MSNDQQFDLMVIGGGSGGVRAARIAASHGAKVAICEESRMGGTCVIRGCVPKKLLVYASHFADDFEAAKGFGWTFQKPEFSWSALIANKDKEIGRLNQIYHRLLDNAGVTTFMGRGVLLDNHRVQVGESIIHAKKILVATGGRPFTPSFPGSEHSITSDEAFDLKALPKQIIISGGGYIAVEFAGIFNGMGSDVTLVYRGDKVLRGFDDDLRDHLEKEMQSKGIKILHHTEVAEVQRQSSGRLSVTYNDGAQIEADQVMFATGRTPYTWDLGLDKVGVEVNAKQAILVNADSSTTQPNIFAVGDVTDRVNLTPVAIREGHAFADTQFGHMPRQADHALVPSAVFSQPPIGTVGYTEEQAKQKFGRLRVYKSNFRAMKYTLTNIEERTLMKMIVADATNVVVGLHIIGMDAAEMAQGFAVAVKAGLTKDDFDATVGIHPTSGEELVTLREYEVVDP